MDIKLHNYPWWNYLDQTLQNGFETSVILLEREQSGGWGSNTAIRDFSFIVFPAAKAYEGFLKRFFLDLSFIGEDEFYSDRFRIGKALNPNLEKNLRHESVYDKLSEFCQGNSLPDKLWLVWKRSRNQLFHWWPEHKSDLTILDAQKRVLEIIDAIDSAFAECRVKRDL